MFLKQKILKVGHLLNGFNVRFQGLSFRFKLKKQFVLLNNVLNK